ncbi:DNAj-like protein [Novymonas esmeraldas]|uniref:DNAj-like protein n=1 Tax=Novymonas esmeraldas TaxID=1808958 RepID=A0AAW0EJG9_9TRYP
MWCARGVCLSRRLVTPRTTYAVSPAGTTSPALRWGGATALHLCLRHASTSSAAASASRVVNFYQCLGVDTDATPQEVKAAYRQLALKHHPDVAAETHKAQSEMLFRRVSEAYEVLSDPARRRAHDAELGIQTRRKQPQAPPSAATATGTSAAHHGKPTAKAKAPQRRRRAESTSSASAAPQQSRYRRPFVRGDANRTFADAFDGKTLDEILFDVQRRRRHEAAARSSSSSAAAASAQRRSSAGSSESSGDSTTATPSSPSSAAAADVEGASALSRDARLRHVMETAAEALAQQAQRQYGRGILRHIRAATSPLPHGPAAPPATHMPFRPFPGTPVPAGVQTPPEPHPGAVWSPHAATVESTDTETPHGDARPEIPSRFHTHTYADGALHSRFASLDKANRYIHGMPHNMGQLYSFHRPY